MAINLRAAGVAVPADAGRRFEAELFSAAADGLAAARQARDLQVRFAAAGIRAVTYKGPALAAAAYGQLARPLQDLDVLVTRSALTPARSILAADGYRLDLKSHRLFAVLPAAARVDQFHPPAAGLLTVELHVAITPWALAARFDTEALVSRAVEVVAGGTPLLTFAPEDHLLVVAAHATAHGWSFLRHVSDLDGLIGAGVDWGPILGTALPADVVSWMRRDREAAALAAYARSRWFDPSAVVLTRWPAARQAARYRERAADKARYIAREQITSLLEKLPWERWRPPSRSAVSSDAHFRR
jgi:hypothetical protein